MKTINVSLNGRNSIKKAIKEIQNYRKSLNTKMELFVSRLMDVGIKRAEEVGGRFAHRVTYEKHLEPTEYGCHGVLLGIGEEIEREWIRGGEVMTGSINALWTMEFGTAAYAISDERFGGKGGAGTASQTGGAHNNDTDWYFYVRGEDGKLIRKHGTAIQPTRPMHNAMLEMQEQITRIAQEVFNG